MTITLGPETATHNIVEVDISENKKEKEVLYYAEIVLYDLK